ncbi:MAG: hypothetical protein LBU40_02195 [Methanobrevibacter sp.]|jgi:hypothetical protein|nr:hypothetical protein [Methanobrevibacter sp.]
MKKNIYTKSYINNIKLIFVSKGDDKIKFYKLISIFLVLFVTVSTIGFVFAEDSATGTESPGTEGTGDSGSDLTDNTYDDNFFNGGSSSSGSDSNSNSNSNSKSSSNPSSNSYSSEEKDVQPSTDSNSTSNNSNITNNTTVVGATKQPQYPFYGNFGNIVTVVGAIALVLIGIAGFRTFIYKKNKNDSQSDKQEMPEDFIWADVAENIKKDVKIMNINKKDQKVDEYGFIVHSWDKPMQ